MNRLWYKTWFDTKEYSEIYKHRNISDANKLLSLILANINIKNGSKILDIPCGTGRHSFILSKKKFQVTGLDISPALVKSAKRKTEAQLKKNLPKPIFRVSDMRSIYYKNEFDLALNLFTSFGYFEKDKDNEKVISVISKALKHNGYFVMDFVNSDYIKENIVPFDIKKINNKFVVQIRTLDKNFINKSILIFLRLNNNLHLKKFDERIKLYSLSQLKKMLNRNGLKVLKIFGDYSGNKFNKNSERLILIAQRN